MNFSKNFEHFVYDFLNILSEEENAKSHIVVSNAFITNAKSHNDDALKALKNKDFKKYKRHKKERQKAIRSAVKHNERANELSSNDGNRK